jgi:hypothetical protein
VIITLIAKIGILEKNSWKLGCVAMATCGGGEDDNCLLIYQAPFSVPYMHYPNLPSQLSYKKGILLIIIDK